jgi:thiol-disulfide isomerase/thioredoxin
MPKKSLAFFEKIGLSTLVFLSSFQSAFHFETANAEVSFFDGKDIDYWREGKLSGSDAQNPGKELGKDAKVSPPHPPSSSIRESDKSPFDWKKYEDPSSVEFWDDGGDYVAPRPLREAVANPTRENLEKYLEWQAQRLVVLGRFNEKLAELQLSKEVGKTSTKNKNERGTKKEEAPKKVSIRYPEVTLLYFYQTSCPHCQASKPEVESLQKKGVRVSFIQLDGLPALHPGSFPYNLTLKNQFDIQATPTWIFRRKESVARLEGRKSEEELTLAMAGLFSSGRLP